MTKFPEEMELTIVDDLYQHYTLGFDTEDSSVMVWCEWCEDVVFTFDQEEVLDLEDTELYEYIIDRHRKAGLV